MPSLTELIDQSWDFEDPAGSEARFRALLVRAEGRDALVLRTQLARAIGLQGRYDEALGLLDLVGADTAGRPEVRVRERLERGRVLHTSGGAPRTGSSTRLPRSRTTTASLPARRRAAHAGVGRRRPGRAHRASPNTPSPSLGHPPTNEPAPGRPRS
ncbi:MAG: hypothetical protein ABI873_19430 [Marmoricola sp.]